MALLETDFTHAIEHFASCWQDLFNGDNEGEKHENENWQDVSIMISFDTPYLRITKCIHEPALVKCLTKDDSDTIEEATLEEDDPEALDAPAKNQYHARVVRYDIVYSPAYQVPVLHLTFANLWTYQTIALPTPDEVYQLLVPDNFKLAMREIGVMGALSMAEHPVTGRPAYFVHPCRTQEALTPLLAAAGSDAKPLDAMDYLLLWFGVIGASVGLSVPVNVARLLADDRGEVVATKLGNC